MREKELNAISGIFLIIASVLLTKTPAYTFIKSVVVAIGGSISLGVAVAIGTVALSFVSGAILLKRT